MFQRLKVPALCAALFVLGLLLSSTHVATADFQDGRQLILGCKTNSAGTLRLVAATSSCNGLLETEVSWRAEPEHGTEFPFMCRGCTLEHFDRFAGRDLSGAIFGAGVYNYNDMSNVNLTNADIAGSDFMHASFTGANLTNNDLTDNNFEFATGLDEANLTNVIWSNTICPDGTNSDENDFTCEGHLTP